MNSCPLPVIKQNMFRTATKLLALLGVGFLQYACSTAPSRVTDPAIEQAYLKRQDILLAQDHWKLAGKLAASDGKEGGSGTFSWHRIGGVTRMYFRGALGKGAWELESTTGQAILQFADGRRYSASSIAELVTAHMHAKVPVDALSWWVLGLARPTEWEERELDQEGRITYLRQLGWDVTFSSYRLEQDIWLPGKLVARNQQNSVKLAISEWKLALEAATFD